MLDAAVASTSPRADAGDDGLHRDPVGIAATPANRDMRVVSALLNAPRILGRAVREHRAALQLSAYEPARSNIFAPRCPCVRTGSLLATKSDLLIDAGEHARDAKRDAVISPRATGAQVQLRPCPMQKITVLAA